MKKICKSCRGKFTVDWDGLIIRHWGSDASRERHGYCPGSFRPPMVPRPKAPPKVWPVALYDLPRPVWTMPKPEYLPPPVRPGPIIHLRKGGHAPHGEPQRRDRLKVTCDTCFRLIHDMRFREFEVVREYTRNRRFRVFYDEYKRWILRDRDGVVPILWFHTRARTIKTMWVWIPIIDRGPR